MSLKQIIEALLFASHKPMLPKEIVGALKSAAQSEANGDAPAREFAKVKEAEVAATLEELKVDYIQQGRAFQLVEKVNGWQLLSDPAFAPWLRHLFPENRPARLSAPALETLAIIAYRQPITRADIEAVRGVAVDGVVQTLLERGLIKIAGRADVPGRPLLYETTEFFLEHFGLRNVDELPNSSELRRVNLPTAEAKPAGIAPAEEPATPEGETGVASPVLGSQSEPAPDESASEALPR